METEARGDTLTFQAELVHIPGRVYVLLPAPIGAVTISAPGEVQLGSPVRIAVHVTGADGKPAWHDRLPEAAFDVAISADSSRVAASSGDGLLVCYDKAGKRVWERLSATPPPGRTVVGYRITQSDVEPSSFDAVAPSSYTFEVGTPEGMVTLYAWAKDSAGLIGKSSCFIFYTTSEPNVSDIVILQAPDTPENAWITWTTDILAIGMVQYRRAGTEEWTASEWESGLSRAHYRVMTGLLLSTEYEVEIHSTQAAVTVSYLYPDTGDLDPEIPKSRMSATASSYDTSAPGYEPDEAINGDVNDYGWVARVEPAWLRLDLGGRYPVQYLIYQGRNRIEGRTEDYAIYVSDDPDPANWGDPVGSGAWLDTAAKQPAVMTPTEGQYVFIECLSGHVDTTAYVGAAEVWLYGSFAEPVFTEFFVANVSGSSQFTNSSTVNVTMTVEAPPGKTIVGYQVTQSEEQPTSFDAAPLTSYTFDEGTPEGNVTLYAWAKDSDGAVGMKPWTILYTTTEPQASNIIILPAIDTPTSAFVTWTTDIPSDGKVRYKAAGSADWTSTEWENSLASSHLRVMTGLTIDTEYEVEVHSNQVVIQVAYIHPTNYGLGNEIPKSEMLATASSDVYNGQFGGAYDAINDDVAEWWGGWHAGASTAWLRIKLHGEGAAVYTVQTFSYLPRQNNTNGRIKDFEIYVTDSTSDNKADWGASVATGTWANDTVRKNVPLTPQNGQYLILYSSMGWTGFAGAQEVWVYGDLAGPVVQFSVASATGSSLVTSSPTVNVTLAAQPPEGDTVVGYQVTETSDEPSDGWLPDPPTTYTIMGDEGDVTLYGWAKDSSEGVAKGTATIYYATSEPVVTNVTITAGEPGSYTATVAWNTDVAAYGAVKYGLVIMSGATPNTVLETSPNTSHSLVMTDIIDGANYRVTLVNNDFESDPIYWPDKWPVPGDANLDCKVNILDLIFVRNRLNQDVGTGDNWQSDVNGDDKINILDLITVRNNLNSTCPQ